MPHVLSGLAPRPRKPEGRTRNREARDRPEGITPTGGSAPNEAHTPNQHTHGKDTPGTPTDRSRQYADCSQQSAVSSQQCKEVTPHMHTPATTHPQDRHTQWKSAPPPTLADPTRPAHPRSATPGGRAGSAPARTRRTDGTPAAVATATATATAAATARARQPRQARPRSDTPTPATPASVAASPNLDPTRLGSSREPLANRSLAVADRLQLNRRPAPDPACDLGQPLAASSLTPAARPKTGPAPASNLGQSLTFSSLTGCSPTENRPSPACDLGQPLTSSSLAG